MGEGDGHNDAQLVGALGHDAVQENVASLTAFEAHVVGMTHPEELIELILEATKVGVLAGA